MRRVIVHIDSLVLKGFRYEDRYTIAAALKDELTRMLAPPEAAQRVTSLGSVPRLKARQRQRWSETQNRTRSAPKPAARSAKD